MRITILPDWTLYHKAVLALIVTIMLAITAKGLTAINGGAYTVKQQSILNAPPATVWRWISSPENRVRWEAALIDMSRLTGDASQSGSTRLAFWRERGRHWNALEATATVVPGLRYEIFQESDRDTRRRIMTLEPRGTCRTKVILNEQIRHSAYKDRFWSFFNQADATARLKASLAALERWMDDVAACPAGKTAGSTVGNTS